MRSANITARSHLAQPQNGFIWEITKPLNIVIFTWAVGFVIYLVAAALRYELPYLTFMAARVIDYATPFSFLWLVIALMAFTVGTLFARPLRPGFDKKRPWSDDNAYRALLIASAVIVAVSALWVGVTIVKVGLGNLASLANDDNKYAREILLNSAFPGGRVISNGYMGLLVFASYYLAKKRETKLKIDNVIIATAIVGLSALYLGAMPILVSGRINFFMAVIGAYIAISMSHGKLYRIQYLPFAILAMAIVWGSKEYFALRHVMQISPIDQAIQGFLFYVYNDFSNAINPIGNLDGRFSYGWESLRFIFYFTFTEDFGLAIVRENDAYIGHIKVAGEIPMLSAPYVDFGLFGIPLLAAMGYFCQRVYYLARFDNAFAPMYGLVFAALVLSVHACYLTSQDSVFNLIIVFLLSSFALVSIKKPRTA